jgi:uncharacterized Zn-binding protein involved in type VI secretion
MSNVVLVGANCEANGHPTNCQEPASGSVKSTSSSNVRLNGTNVYFKSRADMNFPSHAHDYNENIGCHDTSSHAIDPNNSHNVKLNGSPIVLESDKGTDPKTSQDAVFVDSGGNSSIKLIE